MAALEIRGFGTKSYVFIHGIPSDRRVFYDVASLAPEGTTVVLADMPDHGEAPDDPSASMASWDRAALEAVEAAPGDVTVVGHSVGAWLAAALSSRMPARVSRFVAVCGMAQYDEEMVQMRRDWIRQLESHEIAPDDVREMLLGIFFGDERTPELEARVAPMLDLSRERWTRLARRSLEINERPPARFERPATIVHATGDPGIPLAFGQDLARRSQAPLVPIETTSHMIPLTHPRQLADIIYRQS